MAKKMPQNDNQKEKMEKNERNSSTRSIFWLSALPKRKFRCISPFGDVWNSFGSWGAFKLPKLKKKRDFLENIILLKHTKIMKAVVICFNVAS